MRWTLANHCLTSAVAAVWSAGDPRGARPALQPSAGQPRFQTLGSFRRPVAPAPEETAPPPPPPASLALFHGREPLKMHVGVCFSNCCRSFIWRLDSRTAARCVVLFMDDLPLRMLLSLVVVGLTECVCVRLFVRSGNWHMQQSSLSPPSLFL